MKIKEEDFILTPEGDGGLTFNLELLCSNLDKKNGVRSMKMKEVAYSIPLNRAVLMIIQNRVQNSIGDKDVDLNAYVQAHRLECAKVCKALNVRFKIK